MFPWWRAYAWNVCFINSLGLPIYMINWVDKTKLWNLVVYISVCLLYKVSIIKNFTCNMPKNVWADNGKMLSLVCFLQFSKFCFPFQKHHKQVRNCNWWLHIPPGWFLNVLKIFHKFLYEISWFPIIFVFYLFCMFLLQCVKLSKFETERAISFIPPDGEFELMR